MKYFLLFLLLIPLVTAAQYTDDVEHYFVTSDTFTWTPAQEGNVTNIEIDGEIEGTGRVRIHVISGGEQTLLYSRSQQEEVKIEDYVELEEGSNMGLVLNYAGGNWDEDDDGIAEKGDGVDFSLEPVFFTQINEAGLCTVWDVYSVEEETYTSSCYGSDACCSFAGIEKRLDTWDESFVVVEGTEGATKRNIVLARLVYYNGTKVGYSNYDALPAVFVESSVDAANVDVSQQYEARNKLLRISLDEGTYFDLKSISYTIADENVEEGEVETTAQPTQQEPTIISKQNSWSVFLPELTREQFFIENELPLHSIRIEAQETQYNVSIAITEEQHPDFFHVLNIDAPDVRFSLDLTLPSSGEVQAFWLNETWENQSIAFLRGENNASVYRVALPSSGKVGIRLIEEEGVAFNYAIFWWFGGALILALIILGVWGVRRVFYAEVGMGFRQWQFDRDVKKIHKLVKKYGK